MKIGLFTDAYFPIISGVSLSIETLAKELRSKGHEVYIIAHDHENAIPDDHVIRLKGFRLPMKGMKEYRIGKVTRKLVRQMIDMNFDIVHCHTEFTIGRLGRRAAKKAGIPIVHTYHTMYEDYVHFISKMLVVPLRFIAKWYIKRFANSTDAVVFPTVKVKKTFDRYGYEGKGHIIPTGIYLDKFAKGQYSKAVLDKTREECGIQEDDFVLLFLGRVSREKSITTLLQAIASADPENLVLLVVGDGPDRKLFEQQAKEFGIASSVHFLGMVPPDEVGRYYRIADLFVNFSTTETQGLTYIEALASDLPLLVKYDDNLEGVIHEGYNGYTFTKDEEFIPLLETIHQNNKLLHQLSSHACESMDPYTAATYASRIEEVYTSLLEE